MINKIKTILKETEKKVKTGQEPKEALVEVLHKVLQK